MDPFRNITERKKPRNDLSPSNYSSWAHSKMTSFDVSHIWKIDQFNDKVFANSRQISSPMFSFPGHDINFRVCLQLSDERSRVTQKAIEMFFECIPGKSVTGAVSVEYQLSLLKNDGSVGISKNFSVTFDKSGKREFIFFIKYCAIMDSTNKYLTNKHQLNVCCKATVSYNRVSLHSFTGTYNFNEPKFSSNQKAIFDSGKHSDVTIVVGQTEIPAHKLILSIHSPVFDAMFSNKDTMEAQKNRVNIPDVSPDVMKDFLMYIYTGEKPKNDRLSMFLLEAADKYQVLDLKQFCENHLVSTLTTDNVVKTFVLADMHNALNLKKNCLSFITSDPDKVMLTNDWKLLSETRPDLMVKATEAIALKNKRSKTLSK